MMLSMSGEGEGKRMEKVNGLVLIAMEPPLLGDIHRMEACFTQERCASLK